MFTKIFFPALVLAVQNITDIPQNSYVSETVFWAVENNIFTLRESQFQPNKSISYSEFKKGFSVVLCENYAPLTFPEKNAEAPINRSELVAEIYENIRSKVDFPPDWQTVRFYDLSEERLYYEAAQALTSLGILDRNNGYFGNTQVSDPEVTRWYFIEILNRISQSDTCGFMEAQDQDRDLVTDSQDECPRLPAQNSLNGCPQFDLRKPKSHKHETPKVYSMESENISFRETTDIRLGDIFFFAITDPDTGKIYSRSNEIEVRY